MPTVDVISKAGLDIVDAGAVKNAEKIGKKSAQAVEKELNKVDVSAGKKASSELKAVAAGLNMVGSSGGKAVSALASVLSGGWIAAAGVAIGFITTQISEFFENIKLDKIERFQRAMQKSAQALKADEKNSTENKSSMNYFNRLQDLSKIENLDNLQKQEAIDLIAALTEKYGDLGLSINQTTGEIEGLNNAYERFFKQTTQKRQKSLKEALTRQRNVILLNPLFQQLQPEFRESNFQGWNESNQNKLNALSLVKPNEDMKAEDLKQLRSELEKMIDLEQKYNYFQKSGGFTSENQFLGYFSSRNGQIEKMKQASEAQARNIAQSGQNNVMQAFLGNLSSTGAKSSENAFASVENAQQEVALLQRIKKMREQIQRKQEEYSKNRKSAESQKDQQKRLELLIKSRANMEEIFNLNKDLNNLQMQHNRLLQRGFNLSAQGIKLEQQRKRQEFQRLQTTQDQIKWLQNERQTSSKKYSQNANDNFDKVFDLSQDVLLGNNNIDKNAFGKLYTQFQQAFQAGNLQDVIKYGMQLKSIDFKNNAKMASDLSLSIDKVIGSMKQLQLSNQDYLQQIQQLKRQSKLNVYKQLLSGAENFRDRLINPNDKNAVLQKRIRDLEKSSGRPLDSSQIADVSKLVDLEFALKNLKDESKIKIGEVQSNDLTRRGGFMGGAYVPQYNFEQITATNSQQQTVLLRQAVNLVNNLRNEINQIP